MVNIRYKAGGHLVDNFVPLNPFTNIELDDTIADVLGHEEPLWFTTRENLYDTLDGEPIDSEQQSVLISGETSLR